MKELSEYTQLCDENINFWRVAHGIVQTGTVFNNAAEALHCLEEIQ